MNFRTILKSRHAIPLLILLLLCSVYWNRVLVGDTVLLPDSLRGFAPFGADAKAPWNILQWDALGQYFPWRLFAARQLHAGLIPLWNPHQFAGTPFLANGQSAIFYPLSAPFWLLDTARAFGVSAWLHSLLACISTYFLAQRWKLSRAASLLAAIAFGFGGFLTFWISLPTLSNTASWLPLLVLLFERAVAPQSKRANAHRVLDIETEAAQNTEISPTKSAVSISNNREKPTSPTETSPLPIRDFCALILALSCAYFAGHPQIFFYCLLTLTLRALAFPLRVWQSAFRRLGAALFATTSLCAIQILPTLELARLGHRAGQSASQSGWDFVVSNALHAADLTSLLQPFYAISSFDENKGYIGGGVLLLSFAAIFLAIWARFSAKFSTKSSTRNVEKSARETQNETCVFGFSLLLAFFGIAFALATPLAKIFYFGVPGLSQMGGVGRALCLWSLGAALLAAFGLDALRARFKSNLVAPLALLIVGGELFAASFNTQPTASRASIYPPTTLTTFLQSATKNGGRVLLWTPRQRWFASEDLPPNATIAHPPGILPPNGATVYGLDDVNGYDSLSSAAYRTFLAQNEGEVISPPRNGNMVLLNNLASPALAQLDVRFVVVPASDARLSLPRISFPNTSFPDAREVLRADNCVVYALNRVLDTPQNTSQNGAQFGGRDFFPGWNAAVYNPNSFRVGAFFSLLSLGALAFAFALSVGASDTGAGIAPARSCLKN